MPKPSHREKLLTAGLQVVFEQGYCGASVRDIVQAAGVPQGSFTNHFRSKEAFCLEVLERYYDLVRQNIEKTLRNDATAPPERMRAWVDLQIRYLEQAGMRNGCLIGNYGVEASDHSEAVRRRLVEIFAEIHESVAYCLKAAVTAGDLVTDILRRTGERLRNLLAPGAGFADAFAALATEGLHRDNASMIEGYFNYLRANSAVAAAEVVPVSTGYSDLDLMVAVLPDTGQLWFTYNSDIIDARTCAEFGANGNNSRRRGLTRIHRRSMY